MCDEAIGKLPPSGAVDEAREDELRRASSRRRRRAVLGTLRAAGTAVSMDEAVNRVARRERRPTTDDRTSGTDLHSRYHAHLPRFAAANVVAYDRSNRAVRLGPPDDG